MDIAEIVRKCQTLYDDLSLECVRDWKEANPGRAAVGYMPIYVPREILHAAGVLPVGLMGGDMEIIRGDAYFQSYICHIPRSTIELAVGGKLDVLDGMIFPSICDVIRNLSGRWKLLFPDKYAKYLDFPQNFSDGVGGSFYRQELETLLEDMQRLGGIEVDGARLFQSIRLYNQNRRLIVELYELRARRPWRIPTSELYLLLRAGNVLPVEEHNHLLREYRDGIADGTVELERPPMDNSRVVLTGAFCEQPPLGLIRTIERSGCYIVDDDFVLGTRMIVDDIAEEGDPVGNLAQAFLHARTATASVYIGEERKGQALVEKCRARQADGVIFCAASFCDPALLDQPMLIRAVEAEGIPFTEFKFSENTSQFQVVKEQTGTFSDSLKLWGQA